MQSAMGSQYGVGPDKCDVCGVSFTGVDAPPANKHDDTWQHKLGREYSIPSIYMRMLGEKSSPKIHTSFNIPHAHALCAFPATYGS